MTALTDQTVLVTGANRGVGREFVDQLLSRGATKVYAGVRDLTSIAVDDHRVVPVRLDVTDPTTIASAAASAADVSIVINNAGISRGESVLAADDTGLRAEMEANLYGPLAVTKAFLGSVLQRQGAVVNIASVLSWVALGNSYSVSKAGLWSATDSMRLELDPQGVQVLGVYMAYIDTDMTAGVKAAKTSPADAVTRVLDALESGADEVDVDDVTRQARAGLHLPVAQRYGMRTG